MKSIGIATVLSWVFTLILVGLQYTNNIRLQYYQFVDNAIILFVILSGCLTILLWLEITGKKRTKPIV